MHKDNKRFTKLLEIVTRLRSEDGCPWDKKQTPETLQPYLIEESHETVDAIKQKDPVEICEELGDLLFIIVLITQIYEERGEFTISDVLVGICDKMRRRHPHVFDHAEAGTEKELRSNWLEIKAAEKIAKGHKQNDDLAVLSSIPQSLPALKKANRVAEITTRAGFDWPDITKIIEKLDENIGKLKTKLTDEKKKPAFVELGDLLFTVASLGRKTAIDSEEALNVSIQRFSKHYARMTGELKKSDKKIRDLTPGDQAELWHQTKNI